VPSGAGGVRGYPRFDSTESEAPLKFRERLKLSKLLNIGARFPEKKRTYDI
jgi:hypothetical protein